MQVTFWGTRGGVPVSGDEFARHGGATTCFEIAFASEHPERPERIVIDCGTGLVQLGHHAEKRLRHGLFLQTHMHWDHIQGFPFFNQFYDPEASFEFWGVERDGHSIREVYASQMNQPTFPVQLDAIAAEIGFETLEPTGEARLGDVLVEWTEMAHPSGSTAYRIEHDGGVFVFSGDVEVQRGCRERLVEFARGADVFVMDAQYFLDEYEARRGFGHSTYEDAVEVAQRAEVGAVYMTHHDAGHDDARLDAKVERARDFAAGSVPVANARDQLSVEIPPEE